MMRHQVVAAGCVALLACTQPKSKTHDAAPPEDAAPSDGPMMPRPDTPAVEAGPQDVAMGAADGPRDAASADLPAEAPASSEVHGRVINTFGQGIANFRLVIDGKGVTTATDGTFRVPGVAPVYDLIAVDPVNNVGFLVQGLSRRDLRLPLSRPSVSVRMAPVSGTLVGGGNYPLAMGEGMSLFFLGARRLAQGQLGAGQAAGGAYMLTARWSDDPSVSGTLRVLRWMSIGGLPAMYTGYAERELTVTDGVSAGMVNLTLAPVGTATLAGTVTVPAGFVLRTRLAAIKFGTGLDTSFLSEDMPASPSFSYRVPSGLPNTSFTVVAEAINATLQDALTSASVGALQPGANFAVELRASPGLVTPAADATGVDTSTTFEWAPVAGTLQQLIVFAPAPAPTFVVWTTASRARLPDLAAFGVPMPRNAAYQWAVRVMGPYASVDDGYALDVPVAPSPSTFTVETATRKLTTAP
jgi:hypothetical protein